MSEAAAGSTPASDVAGSPDPASGVTGSPEQAVARRKGPPRWGVGLFLLGLVGFAVISYVAQTSGAPVRWIENDVGAGRQLATERKQRIFLYVYEPNEPQHERNERQIFTLRENKRALQSAVCCRVIGRRGEPIPIGPGPDGRPAYLERQGLRLVFRGTPMFVLLNEKGDVAGTGNVSEGTPEALEFFTNIAKPAADYAEKAKERKH